MVKNYFPELFADGKISSSLHGSCNLTHWLEDSRNTNVRSGLNPGCLSSVCCCGFSTFIGEVFSRILQCFCSLFKNNHFKIPIRSEISQVHEESRRRCQYYPTKSLFIHFVYLSWSRSFTIVQNIKC